MTATSRSARSTCAWAARPTRSGWPAWPPAPTTTRRRARCGCGGGTRCYLATDNLKSARLVGRTPAEVIATVDTSGLAFDPATGIGVTLHLLGALPGAGKMGVTCIAETTEQADQMYQDVLVALDAR